MAWLDHLRRNPALSPEDVEHYANKPLLVLLENYVLDSIGELSPEKSELAGRMTARGFHVEATTDWRRLIRDKLDLPDSIDSEIVELWNRNRQRLAGTTTPADPVAFARAFVDQNFAELVD